MVSRFQPRSSSARSVAIVVFAASLLAGSLGLAYLLAVRQHQLRTYVLNGLAVDLPITWSKAKSQHNGSVHVFTDASNPRRQLRIQLLDQQTVRAPGQAIREAVDDLLTGHPAAARVRLRQAAAIRIGPLVGRRHISRIATTQGHQWHGLAVLTEDGRRYWVIHLAHNQVDDPVGQVNSQDESELAQVLLSARGLYYRQAQAADFATLDLDPALVRLPALRQFHRRVHVGEDQRSCLTLTPLVSPRYFVAIRVRGTTGPSTGSSGSLSPPSLLTEQFIGAVGRPPKAGEAETVSIADTQAWATTMVIGDQSVIRKVWYIQSQDADQGLLVEVLCENGVAWEQYRRLAGQLVAVLAQHRSITADPTNGVTSPRWSAGIDNGREFAHQQNLALEPPSEKGPRYYLIESNGILTGCHVASVLPVDNDHDDDNHSRPVQGSDATVWLPQMLAKRQWVADVGNEQFDLIHENRPLAGPNKNQVFVHRMTLTGRQLEYFQPNVPTGPKWSIEVPPGFVWPMTEDYWPTAAHAATSGEPAVVWHAQDTRPPQPVWVQCKRIGQSQIHHANDNPETMFMSVRPMMSLDNDVYWFNRDRQLVRYQLNQIINRGTQGGTVDVVRVDRAALVQTFAEISVDLELVLPYMENRDDGQAND